MASQIPAQRQQNAEDIRTLSGIEHIRHRPGMYISALDIHGLHHLVYEVVDNSIDEAMAARCDFIEVMLHADGSVTIGDNGGGIPVAIHPPEGVSTLELAMTSTNTSGKFGGGAYQVSGGLHGIGVKAVNALSTWLIAEVKRDGHVWRQTYERGVPTGPVEPIRELAEDESTGTFITFLPDDTIFQEVREFNYTMLMQRFREMAYVMRGGVTIHLVDERETPIPREISFYFEGGLRSFVRYLNRNRDAVHDIVFGTREIRYNEGSEHEGMMEVDFALQYTDSTNTTELSFANTINTIDGGTHQTGLRTAVTRVINNYARKVGLLKDKDPNFTGRHTLDGLTALVSVRHPSPQFESQTKVKLVNPEVSSAVATAVADVFSEYLEVNAREARRIVEKCMSAMRIQDALDKQREMLLNDRKTFLSNTTLPGKLADCSDRGPHTELYVVEGDSAGGCFVGETRVALASGLVKTIRELAEDWEKGIQHFGYASNTEGDIRVVPLLEPRLTKRQAALVEVVLDNGETIRCTPDHPFRLRDGSYKAAHALQPGESLMPLKTRLTEENELPELSYELVGAEGQAYEELRQQSARTALSYDRLVHDHFAGDEQRMIEAAANINCKVVAVREINEQADVYDLTVEGYHNFALASGIFVHNSAKQGRDRHFQAILPLRGKILNTERATLNKILDSDAIKTLVSALGAGIREDFNLEKLRYGRLIIMTDADVDGAHIRTLLLTFFFRYMNPIIQEGRLFIAQPPIFRLEYRKQMEYIYPESSVKEDQILANALARYQEPSKVSVQRYKGLGEMNADQLWETTMNPERRTLLRVTLEDAAEADRTFDMLMGPSVPPRRKFIQTHAKNATLDI